MPKVSIDKIVLALVVVGIFCVVSYMLVASLVNIAVVPVNGTEGESQFSCKVEKRWEADQPKAPPLPADTGGITSPDGSKKTWGDLPQEIIEGGD